MQLTPLDHDQAVDCLSESTMLVRMNYQPAMSIYALELNGQDVLMFMENICGTAVVVYPNDTFDHEAGGSIHDVARAELLATDDDE